MRIAPAAVLALLAAASIACSGAPPQQPTPVPTVSPYAVPVPGAAWPTAKWIPYDSLQHGISMPLPEDLAWSVEDRTPWLRAWHAPTTTEIVLRTITTDGLANRARCEKRARDLRPLPERADAIVIESLRVDLPSGFDTIVDVGLLPIVQGQPITGYILAIGGWAKRCFVYALTTRAQGNGAEEAVGDRLALFMERSFLHLEFASDLVPLVPREVPPLGSEPKQ